MGKIVFVTPSLKTGGGNRVFIELANQLCESYEVVIVYPLNSEEYHTFYLDSRLKVVGVGKSATGKWGKLMNVFQLLHVLNREYRDDIQVITDPIFSALSFLLRGESVFRFMQADDYRIFDDGSILGRGIILKFYKWACRRSYRQKVNFIFNSRYVYDQFCGDSGRKDVPCRIVHPAINQEVFRNTGTRQEMGQVNICLVARRHPLKGLNIFLQAYNRLPKEIVEKTGHIRLISQDDLSAFNTAGMEIIVPRSDKDIVKVYNASDIFISTSWREGFGLPPLEAMACGCAVITSNSGGVNEYALAGMNCLMFEPGNVDQLEVQLCQLIEEPALRARLSKAGERTALRFDWQHSMEEFLKVIGR